LNMRAPSMWTASWFASAHALSDARYCMDSTRPPARLCVCSTVTTTGRAEC